MLMFFLRILTEAMYAYFRLESAPQGWCTLQGLEIGEMLL